MAGFKDLGAVGPLFTAAQLRAWCRVDLTGDATTDAEVAADLLGLAASFSAIAETELNRPLLQRQYTMAVDRFPCGALPLSLQLGGVVSVQSITYLPADGGAVQTFAQAGQWELSTFDEPARVALLPGLSWPSTACRTNAVQVLMTAGWPDTASVPESIKRWVLAHVADMNRNREATGDRPPHALPYLSHLLDPHRVIIFA